MATRSGTRKQAERILEAVLRSSRRYPALMRQLPRNGRRVEWKAEIVLVGSAEMTKLNFRYRRKRRPTDVLSFPAPKVFLGAGVLGELVICLPVARAQAHEQRHSVGEELRVLIVHGVLHLLGFDHEAGEAGAKRMARWEKRLLADDQSSGLIARSH